MKVFVAGATGALGKQLVPMLAANAHDVVGLTRTEAKRDLLRKPRRSAHGGRRAGPRRDAGGGRAEPDVIVHELTAIPPRVHLDNTPNPAAIRARQTDRYRRRVVRDGSVDASRAGTRLPGRNVPERRHVGTAQLATCDSVRP
jgi:nucleoside-diphosphate-sugar epimerase